MSKAKRYHERAEECTKLAELTTSDIMQWHYKKIAERYLAMAQAELTKAEKIAWNKEFRT